MATLQWVHWYNTKYLMKSLGDIPPAEAEANFYKHQVGQAMVARLNEIASKIRGDSESILGSAF